MKSYYTILLAIFAFPQLTFSQEIGLSFSKLWTNHYEIESPSGFGIYISQPVVFSNVRLQVEYAYYQNQRQYFGYLVSGFLPYPIPEKERIRSNSYLHSIEISIRPTFLKSKYIIGSLGIGISHNILDGKREALDTKRKADLFGGNKFGVSVALYFETKKIHGFPLSLFLADKFMHSQSSIQTTDIEATFSSEINSVIIKIGGFYKY